MKKLTLIICICFATLAQAQNFRGGAFAGLSMSQIDGDTYSGYHKPGFIVGASVDRAFSENFSMAMELKFLQKGSRASYNIDSESGEYYKAQINYMQIPVLLQYRFWDNFWGEAGLGIAYCISAKEEDDYGKITSVPFQDFEFSGIIGIAYDIPTTFLRVGIRHTNSILPARKIDNYETYGFYNRAAQYNRGFEFTLAYFFR